MKNWISHKHILDPILCLILSVPVVATAVVNKNTTQNETMKITVSDLDLSREEGILTLYQRLKDGVSKICGAEETIVTGSRIKSLQVEKHFKKCTSAALNKAVKNINNKMLTNLHTNKS